MTATVEALVNGESRSVTPGTTVAELVDDLVGVEGRSGVAVARNSAVVPRSEWEATEVQPGDAIEVVHPIQGG